MNRDHGGLDIPPERNAGPSDGDEATAPEPDITFFDDSPSLADTMSCWRCGKDIVSAARMCPYCLAAPVVPDGVRPSLADSTTSRGRRTSRAGIERLLGFYMALLATSIVWGLFCRFGLPDNLWRNAAGARVLLNYLTAVDAIDTIVVIAAFMLMRVPPPAVWRGFGRASVAWLGGVPLLGLLLGVNVGYHAYLKQLLNTTEVEDSIVAFQGLSALVIGVMCVQPAIVEEIFFRHLALGQLKGILGTHGAILTSSLMFGLAHVDRPFSIPVLTLIGVGLGYARVSGGGLMLPIVLHFLHNFIVIFADQFV